MVANITLPNTLAVMPESAGLKIQTAPALTQTRRDCRMLVQNVLGRSPGIRLCMKIRTHY